MSDRRHDFVRGRLRRRCRPRVRRCEERVLPAASAGGVLGLVAQPLVLGTTHSGTLFAGETAFFEINPAVGGNLTLDVHAEGTSTRLSLLDGQGETLMQSEGESATNPADQISLYVPAGTDFLELQNLGGAGTFSLSSRLVQAFPPLEAIPDPAAPVAIAEGDFTGNGHVDLAVVSSALGNVSIFLGNGDGTFQSGGTYSLGFRPGPVTDLAENDAIVAAQFTGDGDIDLAVASAVSNQLSILFGNGNGTFGTPQTYALASTTSSDSLAEPDGIVAGDFTGDGVMDLAVANVNLNTVAIFLNNGSGTFQNRATYTVGLGPTAIAAGGLTGDGFTDLAVANSLSGSVTILLGNGDGTFRSPGTYPAGDQPDAIVAGNFNGDGFMDLAVANSLSNNVSILLGNGTGMFRSQVTYPVGSGPDAIVAGDFTGDGVTDLAVANTFSNNVSILLGNGDGTFQNQVVYPVDTYAEAMVAGNFNGQGIDLAVVDNETRNISILIGNGDGTFQSQPTSENNLDFDTAVVSGDFNGDGYADLAVTNSGDNTVTILLGNGNGTFEEAASYAVGRYPVAIVAGDFNGDGRTDLAIAELQSFTVSILLGNGDGTFQNPVSYPAGEDPSALVAGDFNGDGHLDLAVSDGGFDPGTAGVTILLGDGHGAFQDAGFHALPHGGGALATGDFNGDGVADLAVIAPGGVSVLLGEGHGLFQNPATYPVGVQDPAAFAVGAFTNDGRDDLAVTNSGSDTISVLLSNPDGTFQPQVLYPVGFDPLAIVAGDFTRDGHIDLAVSNNAAQTFSILAGNGDGTFNTQATYPLGFVPFAMVAGDFNGDGRLDLAFDNLVQNSVSVFLNADDAFTAAGPSITIPQANPVLADLRGTGTDDVFVIDKSGNILWRQATTQAGIFDPPIIINPGVPARDITVVDTPQGPVLASVDAQDEAVSLYAWQSTGFVRIDVLPTGLLPSQIVAADLNGDGWDDLVVRNAGDGTLSLFMSAGSSAGRAGDPLFLAPVVLPVGLDVSDVSVANVFEPGVSDLVITDESTGEVGVLRNLGDATFAAPLWLPAGTGLYEEAENADGSASLNSLEGTAGVASGVLVRGGLPDLVVINAGSDTVSVLSRPSNGLIANPVTISAPAQPTVVRVADLNGDGIADLVLLSSTGVSVALGNGRGGFSAFTPYSAGPDPTGLTIASLNGHPDLLVGDAQGDVLVLLGDGDGHFQQPEPIDKSVALAVAESPRGSAPAFYLSSQQDNQVAVQVGPAAAAQTTTVLSAADGLLDPGAVTVADLNGNGVPDLVVANSGGNDVLVYPVLANNQLGQPLNGGFATGTDPVGITVATLNGRPDLVVADKGSDDVTILLNQPDAGVPAGFTFVEGPRLKVGAGPTATVVQDVNRDGIPDLLVSNSGSNDVSVLPGVGGGFFNDTNVATIPVGQNPGPIFAIPDVANPSQVEVVTVNAGSNSLSVLLDTGVGNFVVQETLSSGGETPLTAVEGTFDGESGLLVGNNGDGALALFLDGASGLNLDKTFEDPDVPNPTGLAIDSTGAIYAATDGVAAAFPIVLGLGSISTGGETAGSGAVAVSSPTEEQLILLQPFNPTSLALIATLVSVSMEATTEEVSAADEAAVPSVSAPAALPNQPLVRSSSTAVGGENAATEAEAPAGPLNAAVPVSVTRFVVGLNDALAKARAQVERGSLFARVLSAGFTPPDRTTLDQRLARWSSIIAAAAGPDAALPLNAARAGIAAAEFVNSVIDVLQDSLTCDGAEAWAGQEPSTGQRTSPLIGVISIGLAVLPRPLADDLRLAVRPERRRRRTRTRPSARP